MRRLKTSQKVARLLQFQAAVHPGLLPSETVRLQDSSCAACGFYVSKCAVSLAPSAGAASVWAGDVY